MDFLEVILWCVLGYFIVQLLLGVYDGYTAINRQAEELLKKQLSAKIHVVKEEQHGDHTYWFDLETDQFLAQGATKEEIIEILKKHYSKHIFILPGDSLLHGPEWKPLKLDGTTAHIKLEDVI